MLSGLVPADSLILLITLAHNAVCTLVQYFLPVLLLVYLTERLWRRRSMLGDTGRRAVLVTGCDTGFGYSLTRHLDVLGVPVYAACLTQRGKDRLDEQCSERVTSFLMDVTSSDDIQRAYDMIETHVRDAGDGRCLWGVVNNAGIIGDFGTTEMYTKSDFQKVMDVNFFGQVEVVSVFLPMLKQSHGRIVNIASIGGVFPHSTLGFATPYTPSKYAVVGYSDALREDLKKWGISVSILLPGGHRTDIVSIEGQLARFRAMWERLPESTRLEYGEDWINTVCARYSKLDSLIESLPGPEPVVQAYTDALFSQRPQNRYVVGIDAKVINVIKLLPQRVIDVLIQGPLNMMPLPLPAALQSTSDTSLGRSGGLNMYCTRIAEQTVCACKTTGVLCDDVHAL